MALWTGNKQFEDQHQSLEGTLNSTDLGPLVEGHLSSTLGQTNILAEPRDGD